MLHVPFQELNDKEKRQCLIQFGIDADQVHKKDYIGIKIEKGAEQLKNAKNNLSQSLDALLREEGLPLIERSYV